jgi:3-keto-disaccharide hydrolase/FG-GAP-like repeat
MTNARNACKAFVSTGAAVAVMALALQAADPPDFKADGTFTGSSLAAWHVLGQAEWKAQNGELVGRPTAETGGWLLMNTPLQDLQFYANVRCEAKCRTGVLLRAEKTADGLKGIYVSLADGDFVSYHVTLNAQGQETSRDRIGKPPTGNAATAAANAALKPGEWNPIRINLWENTVRPVPGAGGALPDTGSPSYGPIALYVGGTAQVTYKDVAWKNVNRVTLPKEQVSSRFTMQQISTLYYGWSAAASDINHDGIQDIVSGPFYYLGPSYTERRIYRLGRVYNPATEYAPDMVNFTYDYTGDGWPDILASGWDTTNNTRPIDLYVNPKGADRRWEHTTVLPTPNTESVLMRDLDGDGRPEMIFGTATGYGWAKPDPANPTAPWPVHIVSGPNDPRNVHGMGGVGDVNGDGRADIVVNRGWYEQPPAISGSASWTFHPFDFATATTEMGVYDVNGDRLTDVVASLSVHNWGLAWFEQKKSADGAITFVRHDIAGNYSTKNAGGVVFSEAHAARFVDMTGDKIPDFVVGKRYWSHLENYNGPDPYGPAVIYIYRTVRNPKADGRAEFVPELVHNRSGVGSAFEVMDMNKDGRPDIAVATAYGTHVFLSKPRAPASGSLKNVPVEKTP